MEKNVGGYDRLGRWVLGGAIGYYGLKSTGWRRWLALTAASSLLSTAASQKCLTNGFLGLNTTKNKDRQTADDNSEESMPVIATL